MKPGWMSACLIVSSSLCACAANMKPAQNPDEFREIVRGSMFGKMEKKDFDRPFQAAFNDIRSHAERCFDKKTAIRTSQSSFGPGGFGAGGATLRHEARYTSSTKKLRDGVGQMTVQDFQAGMDVYGNLPPGGRYLEVADIESIGAGRTRVTIYGVSHYDEYFGPVFSWAHGENADCPKLK